MKWSRRGLLAGGLSLVASDAQANLLLGIPASRSGGGAPIAALSFAASTPSGGGYVRGLDIHADGTMICRGDVFPLFVSSTTLSNIWRTIFTTSTVNPAGTLGWNTGNAGTNASWNQNKDTVGFSVWEARIAPTNSNIIYVYYQGNVYRSADRGLTFTATSGPNNTWPLDETNNTVCNTWGWKMAVDPANADCVVAGSPQNGFFVTTNAGGGWTQPAGTPTTSTPVSGQNAGVTGIAFDPGSGTSGSLTNTCYACVTGSGVWRTTTTVNGTWSLLPNSPTFVPSAVVAGGSYYCAGGTGTPVLQTNTLMKFSAGVWSTIATDGNGFYFIAINPNNINQIVFQENQGGVCGQVSTSGSGFSGNWAQSQTAGDCPALQLMPAGGNFFSSGQMLYDPNVVNRIWFTSGIGVWYTDSVTSQAFTGPVASVPRSRGLNSMVTYALFSRLGGGLIWGGQDRQTWLISDPTVEPSSFGLASLQNNIFPTWDADNAAGTSTIVTITNTAQGSAPDHSQVSSDGGVTWSAMPTVAWTASNVPQHIAASTASNWIVLDHTTSGPIYFTTNGGASWATATGTPASGFPNAVKNYAKTICADRVTAGTFYAASSGNGLYKSTNGGSTWSFVAALPTTFANWKESLQSAPGNAGHLWFVHENSGLLIFRPSGTVSYFSTNGGVTWTQIANVQDIECLGFGKTAPGGSGYPTIWIVGWVKVGTAPYKWGVWVSKDFNGTTQTWTWLIDYPADSWDLPVRISGDMNDPTRCYIGMQGSSIIYGSNLTY